VVLCVNAEEQLNVPQSVHVHEMRVEHDYLLRPHVVEHTSVRVNADGEVVLPAPGAQLLPRIVPHLLPCQHSLKSHSPLPISAMS
jgi:hypothetical protein